VAAAVAAGASAAGAVAAARPRPNNATRRAASRRGGLGRSPPLERTHKHTGAPELCTKPAIQPASEPPRPVSAASRHRGWARGPARRRGRCVTAGGSHADDARVTVTSRATRHDITATLRATSRVTCACPKRQDAPLSLAISLSLSLSHAPLSLSLVRRSFLPASLARSLALAARPRRFADGRLASWPLAPVAAPRPRSAPSSRQDARARPMLKLSLALVAARARALARRRARSLAPAAPRARVRARVRVTCARVAAQRTL
jgi:hypothetical protein